MSTKSTITFFKKEYSVISDVRHYGGDLVGYYVKMDGVSEKVYVSTKVLLVEEGNIFFSPIHHTNLKIIGFDTISNIDYRMIMLTCKILASSNIIHILPAELPSTFFREKIIRDLL
jgi:hypothetical protein